MRLKWGLIARAREYRRNTDAGRRVLDLRFSLALVLRAKRKQLGITQTELARRISATQATVSRMERPLCTVSLDQILYALCVLGADDAEIADAFDPRGRADVQKLRARASLRFYLKPARVVDGHYPNAKKDHGHRLVRYPKRYR